jgi:hypothetical protein
LAEELPERLLAVTTRAMLDLVDAEESDGLEFKQTLRADAKRGGVNPSLETAVLKTMAAFANSNGGTLVVGRADDGRLTGLQPDFDTMGRRGDVDGFELRVRTLIADRTGAPTNQLVTIRFPLIRGTTVAVLRVEAAERLLLHAWNATARFGDSSDRRGRQPDVTTFGANLEAMLRG